MGADPNASDQKGWTPLISAADEGNHENVKVLLAAGADRKAMRKGMTAAVHAQAKGYPKLAQQIREFAGTK
jgi:ankyrin repeat protein